MKTLTVILTCAALSGLTSLHAAVLSAKDEAFIKKAAIGGMAEVKLGEIAKEKAKQQGVKEFGSMMADDHGKANAELKSLCESKQVKVPADHDQKHQSKIEHLQKLSDADFDKAYVDEMVADHKKDVAEFEEASKSAKDPEVKAFAEKTLPTLRAHLDRVLNLQKETAK